MKKSGSRNFKGFTVIELIVTMIIVGILAAAVYPAFQNLPGVRAQAAAFRLRSDLRYLQLLAIQTHLATRALFDEDADSYRLQIQNGSFGTWADITNPGTKTPYLVQLNAGDFRGVTFSTVDFNDTDALIFDRLGIPYDDSNAPLEDPAFVTLSGKFQIKVSSVAGKIDVAAL